MGIFWVGDFKRKSLLVEHLNFEHHGKIFFQTHLKNYENLSKL